MVRQRISHFKESDATVIIILNIARTKFEVNFTWEGAKEHMNYG